MVEPAAGYTYNVSAYDTALNESPLSVTFRVKTPEPSTRPDLLGYWKFDERRGVAAIDSSGCGDDGTVELNSWQHIALTWSRTTNNTRLYHDGVEVRYSTHEIGSGSVLDDTAYPYIIGARGALGEVTFFDGLIDEVRLYGYALTEEEIRNIYNSSTT